MARQRSRGRRKAPTGLKQLPWRNITNPYAPVEVLSEEQIERIHDASLTVLEDIGMLIHGAEARDILAKAGADVDEASGRVRFDRGLIMEAVATTPAEFTLYARNPARNVHFGANHINFSPVSSPPNYSDLEGGRRPGTYAAFCDFLRLAHMFNIMHFIGGYPVEPQDLPVPTRHLDAYYGFITLTDRAWRTYALSRDRSVDGIEMMCIARGVDRAQLAREPGVLTMINTNSPLVLDGPMSDGLIEMSRAGQAVSITPFTLAGAMSPVTIAGALTQQNAEALAGLALIQLVNPGAPAIYGGFTSNVDMKSGAPAFGTPEYAIATFAGGQLARRYAIPYRSSNVNASNAVDAQAAYESGMSIWSAVMSHASFVHHGAGWLEGGLCASFEKMIIDVEMLQMMAEFMVPLEVTEATLGVEAMADVGPGGHFFGTQHTLDRYETAFYDPIVSDWRNFETWEETGSLTATDRANTIYKQMLADYQPPPLDAAIEEELTAYMTKRKAANAAA